MSSSDATVQPEEIKLPGFGRPVNTMPEQCLVEWVPRNSIKAIDWIVLDPMKSKRLCFPNAITQWSAANILVREQTMIAMINEITDKPEWDRKVNDETIVAKWKSEALGKEGIDFSEGMFDYCIAELRDKATRFSETGRVIVLDSQAAVIKSDTAIPTSLADELKAAVKPLEDVPDRLKDWHPGSNRKVLDLVHPSLYPLMYGKSRVLPSDRITLSDCLGSCGNGVIIPQPPPHETDLGSDNTHLFNGLSRAGAGWGFGRDTKLTEYWSDSYQWLPCEVAFRGDDEVDITSYINNLHPRHAALYGVLEKIIAKTIPMWNDCLSYFGFDEPRRRVTCGAGGATYEYPLGKERPRDEDEDPDDENQYERDDQWVLDNRVLVQPEPEDYRPYDSEVLNHVDLRKGWKDQGLQIIIKLANIELRPEDGKTFYEGGTWHVEGQLNEHICASAIYYYDESNVTESRLAFRQLTERDDLEVELDYPQGDYEGLERLFGIEQFGPCIQKLGSVVTKEGRLLVFPNVLQHQVQPFKLADPTKPGHRKILAMFLVDPYLRTLSTANIPPQQRDWWGEVVRKDTSSRLGQLPVELRAQVVKMTDEWPEEWPISLEEAKKVREDLMSKRKMHMDKVNGDYEQDGFSFCEH